MPSSRASTSAAIPRRSVTGRKQRKISATRISRCRTRLWRDGAGRLGPALQREGLLSRDLCDAGFPGRGHQKHPPLERLLIAPQRQTGVIAKQAAEADLLSGGRLRLGIGLGWNHVEYEALGAEWKTRGARQAEQVKVLRRLWTESLVSFKGRFHDLNEVSIVPPPVQRPIPIWFGGSSDAVMSRAARLGDGWMPIMAADAQAEQKLAALREQLKTFGRDPAKFGIEGWLRMHSADPQGWA